MKKSISSLPKNPHIALVAGIHGDELIGIRIIKQLKKLKINRGMLTTIIGNQAAINRKKRFIDQDLNRSFPGRKNGNREERLAYDIKEALVSADFVIDIHSTTTDVKNLVIITKTDRATMHLVEMFAPVRVAVMKRSLGQHSLTYHCRAGIVLEYGKDKNKQTFDNIMRDILGFLAKLEMIDSEPRTKKRKTEFYKITGSVSKPTGSTLADGIKNFRLIKRGDTIGKKGKELVMADHDFYPILFGKKSYEEIFGFAAEKVNKIYLAKHQAR